MRYAYWLHNCLFQFKKIIKKARFILSFGHRSLMLHWSFTYQVFHHLVCPDTTIVHTCYGELVISLWDVYLLTGLQHEEHVWWVSSLIKFWWIRGWRVKTPFSDMGGSFRWGERPKYIDSVWPFMEDIPFLRKEGALAVGEGQDSPGCRSFQSMGFHATYEGDQPFVLGQLYLLMIVHLWVCQFFD